MLGDGRPVLRPEVLSNIGGEELGRVVPYQLPGEVLGLAAGSGASKLGHMKGWT